MPSVNKIRKVVLFNDSLEGGAGISIINLSEALQKYGIEVHLVICENKIDFKIPASIPFHLLNSDENRTYSKKMFSRKLQEKLNELGKVDMIMSNSSPSNKILSFLHLDSAYHRVHSAEIKEHPNTFSGKLKHIWRKIKYQRLYSNKNLLLVSRELRKIITQNIGAKPKSMNVIYNLFDFEKIKTLSQKDDVEIPKEEYIIHVGRFDMVSKRHDILLKAYAKSGIAHKLVILGDGKDKLKIQKLIQELRLTGKVILPGFKSNPYPWIINAKLLVMTSDFEGLPTVMIEALILNTPVVSTDCPTGPSEIMTDLLSDYLVPMQNVDLIADKINKALLDYPLIPDTVIKKFQENYIVLQYIELIKKENNE